MPWPNSLGITLSGWGFGAHLGPEGPAYLRVLPGLNKVSEVHRHALQAAYLLNPVNEVKTTLDYEWIMTFFCSLLYFFKERQLGILRA